MNSSSLADGRGQLHSAVENLLLAWESSGDQWKDAVRERFQQERIDPLVKQVDMTFTAIQQLSEVLSAAKRACVDAQRGG